MNPLIVKDATKRIKKFVKDYNLNSDLLQRAFEFIENKKLMEEFLEYRFSKNVEKWEY